MLYLTNAFSLNMLPPACLEGDIGFRRVGAAGAARQIDLSKGRGTWGGNFIGHADTDAVVRKELRAWAEEDIEAGTRGNVVLHRGDSLIVAQYVGPRLPEGATALPEGARIDYLLVSHQAEEVVAGGCAVPPIGHREGDRVVAYSYPATDCLPGKIVWERVPLAGA